MSEIILDSVLTIGKVPDYQGQQFGKLQISSTKLKDYIGKKAIVKVILHVMD